MKYFVGIDGGGTRTTAWLSDEKGRVLARAVAGPSNPLKVGIKSTQREILRATREVLRQAHVAARLGGERRRTPTGRGSTAAALEAVCVGLAGTDRPPVHRKVLAWLRQAIPARHHLLTSDAAIALRAAIADSPGVIVISGTGSIAYGRDDRGRVLRSGGWGAFLDDAGSGYDLGRKAIVAALQVLEVLQRRGRTLAQALADYRPLPQKTVNVRITTGSKPLDSPSVQSARRDAEAALAGQGRLVLRPSGTEPLVRVTVEAADAGLMQQVLDRLSETVRAAV